jgi:CMP-N-acetylneuraminic acid synthetase
LVFKGLRVLAVIPARGGSKGIPKKNIAPVAGKPLISYTTELTQTLAWLDSTVVSTDSQEIAEVATQTPGVEIIWRPEELSGDRIGDHPVLRHALLAQEDQTGEHYDIVLMLQPTSPLRTAEDIEGCITQLREGDWDAVWSVSETELAYHPRKQLALSPTGNLGFVIPGGQAIVARQE